MRVAAKEKRFLDALEALFTGAEVEGDSGFVNLMRMKRQYFQSWQEPLLEKIDGRVEKRDDFREELFDKLYTFFSRYFCESGSIYFRHLPAFAKIYERVYADGEDVALSWKTQMLYYVKSDVLVRSMPVELKEEGPPAWKTWRFYFDASQIEHKRNNEKREFVFAFSEVEKTTGELPVLRLQVSYSEKGKKTKVDDILKRARKAGLGLSEERLEQAFRVFRRQTEADYFINKDARGFLREQFDLWMHQYLFQEETIFEQKRLNQLQFLQETAYDIIDFIAQFEDELRRAWEKPKFVRNVNYVVTLDKLPDKTLKKITEHKGAKAQIKEWRALGMVDDEFSMTDLFKGQKDLTDKNGANGARKFLPLDTKHFKTLEVEILEALGNLDEALDGELAHSENWQALNTLQRRYKEKVKCAHIDPPYNTKTSGFLYQNGYKHCSWLTMMENRTGLATKLLSESGSFLCHIDENEYERLHLLMESGDLLDAGTVIWDKRNPVSGAKGVATQHEYVIWRMKTNERFFYKKGNAQTIMLKAKEFVEDAGTVNNTVRKQFKNWIRRQTNFSVGEKSYSEIEETGRVYRCVHMGAPEQRKDKKFHIPLVHPITEKPCPVPASGWSGTPEFMQDLLKQGRIVFGRDETIQPQRKYYLDENVDKPVSSVLGHGGKGKADVDRLGVEFPYCHPVALYEYLIGASSASDDVVLDYFAGSGTTAHAVINLNREDGGKRKYVLVEMGGYFHTVLLPRIKKVVYSKDWKDGKPVSHEGSSHCLKYYTLEQYEETLKNARYKDGDQLEIDSLKSPFEQYVFFGDDKLAHAVQSVKNGKLKINLKDLYKDIDIAESLSNILGKPIRHRAENEVTFTDGTVEKTNPAKMTEEEKQHFITLIKPYLWWGE